MHFIKLVPSFISLFLFTRCKKSSFKKITRCSIRSYKNTPKNLRKSKEQAKAFHFILLQNSTLSVVSNLTFTLLNPVVLDNLQARV